MKTLKEYVEENIESVSWNGIMVCPAGLPKHIFSYVPKINGIYCDIGSSPYWCREFSNYTGEWVPMDRVWVVEE
jgi:hypothetical protein